MHDHQSVVELLAAGKAIGAPVNVPGRQIGIVIPQEYGFVALPPAEPEPLLPYIRQTVQLSDTESFVAYVKRYQTKDTVIFATLPTSVNGAGAEFRAVFDYHIGGKGEDHKPDRTAHQAYFPCPQSTNWAAWLSISGKAQSQDAFINFIEANGIDIVAPDTAALLELAVNFEAKTEVEFISKVDRLTGARKLTFNETVTNGSQTKGSITVPDSLKLKLPVFEGGKPFDLAARLEWRPSGGKLNVTVHLLRPMDIVRAAVNETRKEIAAAVEIEPMTGKLV